MLSSHKIQCNVTYLRNTPVKRPLAEKVSCRSLPGCTQYYLLQSIYIHTRSKFSTKFSSTAVECSTAVDSILNLVRLCLHGRTKFSMRATRLQRWDPCMHAAALQAHVENDLLRQI